jgi:hypothetical protein
MRLPFGHALCGLTRHLRNRDHETKVRGGGKRGTAPIFRWIIKNTGEILHVWNSSGCISHTHIFKQVPRSLHMHSFSTARLQKWMNSDGSPLISKIDSISLSHAAIFGWLFSRGLRDKSIFLLTNDGKFAL